MSGRTSASRPIKLLPGQADWLVAIRRNIVGERRCTVAGTEVHYTVFRRQPGGPDADREPAGWGQESAGWGEDGSVYIADEVLRRDERRANLYALHEQTEYQHRAAWRPHAYAHRRAYLSELLAAKEVFDAQELARYVRDRIDPYPAWKVPDPDGLTADLVRLLAAPRPRRGELMRLIKVHLL
ncbi:MAG: hypothetical protein ACRDI2_02405 [Chloroflexota bacterium]